MILSARVHDLSCKNCWRILFSLTINSIPTESVTILDLLSVETYNIHSYSLMLVFSLFIEGCEGMFWNRRRLQRVVQYILGFAMMIQCIVICIREKQLLSGSKKCVHFVVKRIECENSLTCFMNPIKYRKFMSDACQINPLRGSLYY